MQHNFANRLLKKIQKVTKSNNPRLHEPYLDNFEIREIKKCIKGNFVSTAGPQVKKFEKKLAKLTGSKFVIATNSGTSALHLALKATEIDNNSEVTVRELIINGTKDNHHIEISGASKLTVEKLLKEKATWNSFSGSLKKIENDLISIPSIRGSRYYGPSQMSFTNLIKHSLSIISVFRKTFLIRSGLFIIIYILMIKSNASIITSIPLIMLLIAVYSVSNLALRENMDEFKNSLNQIKNTDEIQ